MNTKRLNEIVNLFEFESELRKKGNDYHSQRRLVEVGRKLDSIMASLSEEEARKIVRLRQEGIINRRTTSLVNYGGTELDSTISNTLSNPQSEGEMAIVKDVFIRKGLVKGFRKIKALGINYHDIEQFVLKQVQESISNDRIGEVLSFIYQSGRTCGLDILSLLKSLYEKKEYASFLKHVYRFNFYYPELFDEVNEAIQWHIDTNKNDALAWKYKFDQLLHETPIQPNSVMGVNDVIYNNPQKDNTAPFLKLTALNRKAPTQKQRNDSDDESTISVIYEKSKLDIANLNHKESQSVLESFLDMFSIHHRETKHIDVYASVDSSDYIFEVKSITKRNEGTQTREAVGQLHEYAYLYRIAAPNYYLVYSSRPATEWLIDYLETNERIEVLWVDKSKKYGLDGPGLNKLIQACLRDYKSRQ